MKPTKQNDRELRDARAVAKKALANIGSPRIRELLTNGLLFSTGGATQQSVILTYAPILTEMGVDFILSHMHDSVNPVQQDLAHKMLRDIIGHGVKIGITETILSTNAEDRDVAVSRFRDLQEVMRVASAKGIGFEDALVLVGKEIKGVEIVEKSVDGDESIS